MTTVEIQDKRDIKKRKLTPDDTNQFRVVQSVKVDHIRGGHAFHKVEYII